MSGLFGRDGGSSASSFESKLMTGIRPATGEAARSGLEAPSLDLFWPLPVAIEGRSSPPMPRKDIRDDL